MARQVTVAATKTPVYSALHSPLTEFGRHTAVMTNGGGARGLAEIIRSSSKYVKLA